MAKASSILLQGNSGVANDRDDNSEKDKDDYSFSFGGGIHYEDKGKLNSLGAILSSGSLAEYPKYSFANLYQPSLVLRF